MLGAEQVEGAALAGDDPRAVDAPERERPEAERIARPRSAARAPGTRASRRRAPGAAPRPAHPPRPGARARAEVEDRSRCRRRLEDRPLDLQGGAHEAGIDQVAVVGDRDRATVVAQQERLRVRGHRSPRSSSERGRWRSGPGGTRARPSRTPRPRVPCRRAGRDSARPRSRSRRSPVRDAGGRRARGRPGSKPPGVRRCRRCRTGRGSDRPRGPWRRRGSGPASSGWLIPRMLALRGEPEAGAVSTVRLIGFTTTGSFLGSAGTMSGSGCCRRTRSVVTRAHRFARRGSGRRISSRARRARSSLTSRIVRSPEGARRAVPWRTLRFRAAAGGAGRPSTRGARGARGARRRPRDAGSAGASSSRRAPRSRTSRRCRSDS